MTSGESSVLVALRVKASPARAFDVFTQEIGVWWRPDPLFEITPRGDGRLKFEGGEGGRVITELPNGKIYVWDASPRGSRGGSSPLTGGRQHSHRR